MTAQKVCLTCGSVGSGDFIQCLGKLGLASCRFEPVVEKVEGVTKKRLLEMAIETVADRGLNYGKPEDNFARIARLWRVHLFSRYGLENNIDEADVAMMMVLMKVARLQNTPGHIDSWADLAGYAACGAEITGSNPA